MLDGSERPLNITSISCELQRTTNIGEYESVKTCAGATASVAPGDCPESVKKRLYDFVEACLVEHTSKALPRFRRKA